jgi:hypothetical protein
MVVGQKIALGRIHKHLTVTVLVSQITWPPGPATATCGPSARRWGRSVARLSSHEIGFEPVVGKVALLPGGCWSAA